MPEFEFVGCSPTQHNGPVVPSSISSAPQGWLDQHIWPQIHSMMLNDAYFKLMGRARELAHKFNGPIAGLIEVGNVTTQTMTIRRLCDSKRDVVSLRRLLAEIRSACPFREFDELSLKLDGCDHVCGLVNNYIAHTPNPLRRPNVGDWNLQLDHLTEAQKAICEVAIRIDRDVLRRRNYIKIIPIPQFDIMEEFRPWVTEENIKSLWEFWHANNDVVTTWIS